MEAFDLNKTTVSLRGSRADHSFVQDNGLLVHEDFYTKAGVLVEGNFVQHGSINQMQLTNWTMLPMKNLQMKTCYRFRNLPRKTAATLQLHINNKR